MKKTITAVLTSLLLWTPALTVAEQSQTFGEYTAHHSAFTTDVLSPEVARAYGIRRSSNRAMLNVSILREVMGNRTEPVRANIEVTATNLNSQMRELSLREVGEQRAIYYIAEFFVDRGDSLTFNVSFTPQDAEESYSFSFSQQFYTQ